MKNFVIIAVVIGIGVVGYLLLASDSAAPAPEEAAVTIDGINVETRPATEADGARNDTPTEGDTEPLLQADAETNLEADVAETVAAEAAGSAAVTAGAVREFTLDSFNFGYSMDTIEVNEGDTVTINLTSSDGFHDWVVDEFDAATEKISAGEETSVTFVADAAGTYEYYCSVGSHRARGMVGTLIVN